MQIVVLGMHRSGTSVITRLINLMGAYFGPDRSSTGANWENPKGFWERRDVRDENDAVLWSVDADWWKISDFSLDRVPEHARRRFDENSKKIIRDLNEHRPWIMKEPRFCLLLPMWRLHLDSPVCVVVHRSPVQVAHSLERRNGFPLCFGIALWERYVLESMAGSAGLPRVVVRYEDVMSDPIGEVDRLLEALTDVGAQGLYRPSESEIESFISDDLFHHRQSVNEHGGLLNHAQQALSDALAAGTAIEPEQLDPLSTQSHEILRLYEELCESRDIVKKVQAGSRRHSSEKRKARQEASELSLEMERHRSRAERLEAEIEHARRNLVRAHEDHDRLQRRNRKRKQEAELLQDRVAELAALLDDARRESRSRADGLHLLTEEQESLKAEIEEFKQANEKLRSELSDSRHRGEQVEKELGDVRAELTRATDSISDTRARLDEAHARLESLRSEKESWEIERRRVVHRSRHLEAEIKGSLGQITSLKEELEVCSSQLDAAERARVDERDAHTEELSRARNLHREEMKARLGVLASVEAERDLLKDRASGLEASRRGLESQLNDLRHELSKAKWREQQLEQHVEELLVFLRLAQKRSRSFSQLRRWTLGPLELWPRNRTAAALEDLSQVFQQVGRWVQRRRSELVSLVHSGRAAVGTAIGIRGSALESEIKEPMPQPPHPSPAATPRLSNRRFGLTVAVVAWDVGHNPLGRAFMLADMLRRHYRVVLLGPSFARYGLDVWEPVRLSGVTTIPLPGAKFPEFAEMLQRVAPRIAADVIVACKPRLPSVYLGLLMKSFLNRPLIIDVDDFELSFFSGRQPLSIDDLKELKGLDDLRIPYGETWTRFCENIIPLADSVLVSNEVLQRKYGGVLVPHVRDERVFDPSFYDRGEQRRQLGIEEQHRVVLFVGTPRQHKGVFEVLTAVKACSNPEYRLVIVGDIPDKSLGQALKELGGDTLIHFPSQPFENLPGMVLTADLVCLYQDPESEISQSQLPAKVVDAMAMGVPVVSSPVPPLAPLIDAGVVEAVEIDRLPAAIDRALSESDERRQFQLSRRAYFLSNYSYSAVSKRLVSLINSSVGATKPVPRSVLDTIEAVRPHRIVPSAGCVDSDDGVDVVVFWKQNDTGLYGRRHDMLVKHMARRPEIRKLVVFDHPISLELLQERARAERTDQWRDVYRETMLRRWGVRDTAKICFDCFVYSTMTGDRHLQIWPWPRRDQYVDFLEHRFSELDIDPQKAVFWFYPRNTSIPVIVDRFRPQSVVVDVVDDHRTWPNITLAAHEQLTAHYREVLALADLAMTNCEPVQHSMSDFHRSIRLIPNGCEMVEPPEIGTDQRFWAFREIPGPKLGFVGNLEAKIDVALLEFLARRRPDWQIVLIGSTHANPQILRLDEFENVHFIGVVTYPQVRAWIRELDVALVPHVDTEQTRSMNPLKVLVYCSLGVPVVSAHVQNLGEFEEFVYMAHDHESFLAQVEIALETRGIKNQESLDACLVRNSWESRVEDIMVELNELLGKPKKHQTV